MREIRQCSARERIRSSSNSRFANVPDARRVENVRAVSSSSDSPSSAQYIRTTSSAGISATSAAKSICKAHSRALRREPILNQGRSRGCLDAKIRVAFILPQKLPCKDLLTQLQSWQLRNPCYPA